ncbi:energy-coupling factor transporter transmembrane protein EcfT [Thauera sp. Sel9]|uniref:energy-coupling factor transporter transmembrane protein EcfT n=1 Tax=Thauera sp. Sel9 TaxID=2974299 RepID=UPI0021E1A23C|nr:energy-coupling factor transporter transmembrane protein EcfT [Thauera sp. Sel9]MCV2218059.1 energy-coupling factor transporter transmembrane protein EcfT [Thauera sp. Sel9]
MHSGLLLSLWFAGVASVQFLAPGVLAWVVAASLALALGFARDRALRLLRRVRVLMFAIVLLFGWFTPGEAMFASWPRLSPSREGMMLALVHGGRLIAVVCAVALLLERLPVERLVGGLYCLSRPFSVIGLRAGDLALRLMLVLRFVEASPRGSATHWKDWLRDAGDDGELQPVRLVRERLGPLDVAIAAALGLLGLAALSWGLPWAA